MAFEQEHTEELEQLQKQKENERIQQELDLALARIENEQIQRALDAAIERLDQQISDQDENTEEQVIDDHEAHQSSSTEEELASHDSVTEEKSDQQNSLGQSIQTWDDKLFSQHEENNDGQPAQIEDFTKSKYSIQEEEVIERDQEVELNLLQMREENKQFQQELDAIIERLDHASEEESSSHNSVLERDHKQLNSLEHLTQSTDERSICHQEECAEEQQTQNLELKNAENSLQEISCHESVTEGKLKQSTQFEKSILASLDHLNHDIIKEKTESSLEKEEKIYYSKQLEETIKHQETLHQKLESSEKEKYVIKKCEHSVIKPITHFQSTVTFQKADSLSESGSEYISNRGAKESFESKKHHIRLEDIFNFRWQNWFNGYIENFLTEEYLSSEILAKVDLLSNGCKFFRKPTKRDLANYMLKISNTKMYNLLPDDELLSIYIDIPIKTSLIDGTSDIIAVLPFKRPKKTSSHEIYLKSNMKGSVVISNNGIHILTSDPDGFNLAKKIADNGLNPDAFRERLILGENLFNKLTFQLNKDDLRQLPQLIIKAVSANKDTNRAFGITATQLGENNISQIRLTDVVETEIDKRKLNEYLKKMNPRFARRSFADIYKYYMTYDSINRKVVSKIEKIEEEIKDLMGSFSLSYDWQAWRYFDSNVDGVIIRYNIDKLDGDATFRIQILGNLTDDGKRTIKNFGEFVTGYKNKKTRIPREITYDKIRQTIRGRSLLNDIRNQSRAMLEEADRFMEDLFPMIELSNQSSNRSLSQSGTRVLNDYRLMTGPGIDYDFSIIQNYHITDEVNEIQPRISYGIGYEISFNKNKFDTIRMDLSQEVIRRTLILEGFQKNILTRNCTEELPGSGIRGYFSHLLDIYESSPGKGWKDILPNDPVYQFYNTRIKQLSMSAGKLSTPVKGWERGRITSTLIQGDRIFNDLYIQLKGSPKKVTFPSNSLVKKTKNKIIKELKTKNRILTTHGVTIGDVKSKENIIAINRGLQRFQRGNENAGGTELFKEYLERLLIEKRDLLGKNGLGLDLKKKYSVHLEYSLAKNNLHEDFNYSIGAPDVVIEDAETKDLAATIQLKGHSQNDSHFNTSISFFQMIEAKLLTETTGIITAFVHIDETISNAKVTGKLENVRYDWLVFNKTDKVSITDLEKALWHTLVIRQVRQSGFSENIFNDITELITSNSDSFEEPLELAIKKRIGEIIEKLEQVKNDILYNNHAQGFNNIILGKYFTEGYFGINGAYMTDHGINAVYNIVQNNILGRIDKNALKKAIRNGQSSFQYQWNKTILIDCWEKQIIELLKVCTCSMQDDTNQE